MGRANSRNTKTKELNKAKIVTALDAAKSKGLTRKELLRKTGICSRRILRMHLRGLQKLVTEAKGRLYLTIHYENLKTESLHSHEAWAKLSTQMLDWAKVKGLIPISADYGDFFSKHGVLLYPEKTERGFNVHFVFCSIEKPTSGPEAFKLKPLWNT